MIAMVLRSIQTFDRYASPLVREHLPDPIPADNEILIRVSVCGVCHTELDEIEGRTPPPRLPVVLGHQVVGNVEKVGKKASRFRIGTRVGVAWIHSACGKCKHCLSGNENLCPQFQATGRDKNGGYAQYMTVQESFAYLIPSALTDAEAAPLLCAGAIGYRSLCLTNLQDGQTLGLMGFGASGHLILKIVNFHFPSTKVFTFSRSVEEREFARSLGAVWSGDISDISPEKLDSIIDTTPVWRPVVEALKNLEAGGRLVINAIRKEEFDKNYLLKLDYSTHIWLEKEIKSVANVSRQDVSDFLRLASEAGIRPEVQEYPLEEANRVLLDLKQGKIRGAKVLKI